MEDLAILMVNVNAMKGILELNVIVLSHIVIFVGIAVSNKISWFAT